MKTKLPYLAICSVAILAVGCTNSLPRLDPTSNVPWVQQRRTLTQDRTSNDLAESIQSASNVDLQKVSQVETTSSTPTPVVSHASLVDISSVERTEFVDPAPINDDDAESVVMQGDHTTYVSLEDLLSLAFGNNAAIRELEATTQIAAGYRTQVGLYANPLVGYQGQQLADEGTDQHLVFVEQEIVTGGKLQLNRAVLNEAVRAQLQELEAQKLRVATDVKTAYFDCLRLQNQLGSIDQFLELLGQGVTAANRRMQAGEGSKIDLLQTQVQFKQLELDRRQTVASLHARLRELVAIAGVPNMELRGVAGTLPTETVSHDWRVIQDSVIAASPEYSAAQARIRQASVLIRRHEAQVIPNLIVQVGAGRDNSTDSGMMNVQVGAPIPIFNKNQGNLTAAKAEYCRAIQEAQRIANDIRSRLASVSGEYDRAAEAVAMYNSTLVPAAQEALDLAEMAWRAGEQDFIQLLVARRTYFDTNLASLAARAQLATTQAQIDGYLLSGALNAVINNSGDDSLRGLTFGQQ